MKRRDSVTGQLHSIGNRVKSFRRKSLKSLSFLNPTKFRKPHLRSEAKDIELIEDLVHERKKFDWNKYERLRRASNVWRKGKFSTHLRRSNNSRFSRKHRNRGAVVAEVVESETEDEEGSRTQRCQTEERIVSKMLGKEKINFVIEFAKPAEEEAVSPAVSKLKRDSDASLFRRMSRGLDPKIDKASVRGHSDSVSSEFRDGHMKVRADGFAKTKGFASEEDMEKHLQRLRGLEELKNETEIELMARDSGYKPVSKPQRLYTQSNSADTGDFRITGPEILGSNTRSQRTIANSTIDESESESESEEESDDDSDFDDDEVEKFMNSESCNLEELILEWDDHLKKAKEKKAQNKKLKKKKVKKAPKVNAWQHQRRRPYDSLGPAAFDSLPAAF
eukprot:maker-scaffold_7-snap-gene-12.37-mRNA-1 protein AED:0.00 eAED:0.00 QI:340/1/1/1/1/1/2/185/390